MLDLTIFRSYVGNRQPYSALFSERAENLKKKDKNFLGQGGIKKPSFFLFIR